jgi:hypothetical protein
MSRKKMTLWLSLLLIGTLLMTACAPRTGGGATAAAGGDQALLVDLPAIVIDFDADGQATLAGVPVADLNPGLATLDTMIGPDTIGLFTENNIQHLQLTTTPTGVEILVNGQAIPSLAWDGESLVGAQRLLGALGNEGLAVVEKILPQIANIGIGVTLRFPPSQGAELIPLTVTGEGSAAATAAQAQQAYLAQAGSPARINLPITYASDGSFSIGSLSAEQLTVLLGAPVESLTLTEDQIAQFAEAGISSFTLTTDSDGVQMTLNGEPLPHISWGDGKLAYGLGLALQTGLIGGGEGGDMGALVERLLPIIQTAEVNVQVTFPE